MSQEWHVKRYEGRFIIEPDIAVVYGSGPNAERHARVLAAAQTTLAALKDLAEFVETGLDAGLIKSVNGFRPEVMSLRAAWRAIAKAEGTAP